MCFSCLSYPQTFKHVTSRRPEDDEDEEKAFGANNTEGRGSTVSGKTTKGQGSTVLGETTKGRESTVPGDLTDGGVAPAERPNDDGVREAAAAAVGDRERRWR